jgi:hypothetical protein
MLEVTPRAVGALKSYLAENAAVNGLVRIVFSGYG